LAIVSRFFFPISYLPGWVQGLVQLTPMYWIGMGMRSVFLPAEAAAVELHGTFQTTTALVVIAGWAVVGFLLAPSVLRQMANRQSGSVVAAARERVLSRGY
jgi:ABC-2 type transport system permease protein